MEKDQSLVNRQEYLQMMPIDDAKHAYEAFGKFVASVLKKDLDYGIIPGTAKPTLYKPGAEKLRFVYGISIEIQLLEGKTDIEKLFVDYTYRATAKSSSGIMLAQSDGNCNSMEVKYGYIWKDEAALPPGIDKTGLPMRTAGKKLTEMVFAVEKAETTGKYGKPAEYWQQFTDAIAAGKAKKIKKKTAKGDKEYDAWELDTTVKQYRIVNPDVIGMKNTIMKMAQKRAFLGAMLMATGASEYFTQDIEDMDLDGTGAFSEKVEAGIVPSPAAATDIEYEDMPPPMTGDFNQEPPKTVKTTVQTAAGKTTVKEEQFIGGTSDLDQGQPGAEAPKIPGLWYAKLERCKTPEDVDELGKKNADTINAHPQLRKLFVERKAALKKLQTQNQ